jgi:Ca2+/Na+ antiporter
MLASFNYYEPPLLVWLVGGAAVLAVHALVVLKVRRLWLGALVAAFGTGLPTAAVFACGKGDMTGLMTMIFGGVGFIGGAVVGLACSALGRALHKPAPPKPPEPSPPSTLPER